MADNMDVQGTEQQAAAEQTERTGASTETGKTFTQEEVDEIVKKRLARERKKAEEPAVDPLAEREKALQDKENGMYARERFLAERIPDELMELVAGRNKDDIDKFIKILKPYMDRLNEPIMNPVGPTGFIGPSNEAQGIRSAMGLSR